MKFLCHQAYTAIPYRASTGPEQGFPCVVFPTGKNLFSSTGNPAMKTGFSLCGNTTQEKPCSGPVLALYGIAVQSCSYSKVQSRHVKSKIINEGAIWPYKQLLYVRCTIQIFSLTTFCYVIFFVWGLFSPVLMQIQFCSLALVLKYKSDILDLQKDVTFCCLFFEFTILS